MFVVCSWCIWQKWLLDIKKSSWNSFVAALPMTLHLFTCSMLMWYIHEIGTSWTHRVYWVERSKEWARERERKVKKERHFILCVHLCGSNECNNWNVTSIRNKLLPCDCFRSTFKTTHQIQTKLKHALTDKHTQTH